MSDAKKVSDPAIGFKNAYFEVVDQTFNLAKQSSESAKKMFSAAFDTQTEIVNLLSQNKMFPSELVRQNLGFFESATKQTVQGLDVAKTFVGTFTDAAINWQKMALDAQKSAIQSYANWFQMFRV